MPIGSGQKLSFVRIHIQESKPATQHHFRNVGLPIADVMDKHIRLAVLHHLNRDIQVYMGYCSPPSSDVIIGCAVSCQHLPGHYFTQTAHLDSQQPDSSPLIDYLLYARDS
jgi:hypothetical protein